MWRNGVIEQLTLPLSPSGVANDINDNNQIIGWMGTYPEPPWIGEAFLWDNGKVTALGFPKGGTNSEAKAISNNGKICGQYTVPANNSAGFLRRGFYWANGTMIDMGVPPWYPPGTDTYAVDINDAGQIVGDADYLWQDGVFYRLQDLIPPDSGLTIYGAEAINNAGQITGVGRYDNISVGFILTPIPPVVGDVTCDQRVNVSDLLMVINQWHFTNSPVDLNHDNVVDVHDLMIVIEHWGAGS